MPGGPFTPPPCKRCRSAENYYANGLCGACHLYAPQPVRSCLDCYAWGATRHLSWLCKGCNTWRRTYRVGECTSCRREIAVDNNPFCRLCRKQGTMMRENKAKLDVLAANRNGQQLFLADMFTARRAAPPARLAQQAPIPPPRPGQYPVAHRQLELFALERDLGAVPLESLPPIRDEVLTAWVEQHAFDFGRRHGWSIQNIKKVAYGLRRLLALQETPGAAITTSELAVIKTAGVSAVGVHRVLDDPGMLIDDRDPAIRRWFAHQVDGLPEPIRHELWTWFDIMLDGSTTPPRRKPRTQSTIRVVTGWIMPPVRSWATQGLRSLREVTREHLLDRLAHTDNKPNLGQGLRSLFGILKQCKLIFTNPTARLKTGYHPDGAPLLANPTTLRQAMDSTNPVQAAMVALSAFYGLNSGQLRGLLLTDIDNGYLRIGARTIPLAPPVLDRLRGWLDTRGSRWPNTANPHLFITRRTATTTKPASIRWCYLMVGNDLSAQTIRADRLLDEALASNGDARRIADMFGLSIKAATRYATVVDHPDLRGRP